MNERIRELERQARQLAQEAVDQKKYNTYSEYQQSLSDQSYAEFAQLIVQECIDTLYKNGCSCIPADRLKEHFGVEE